MTTRRGFLGAVLAAAAAPAIIKAEALMPMRKIIVPDDPIAEMRKVGSISIVGASGLRVGDVITLSGVFGAPGVLKRFVVSSEASGSGVLAMGVA